MTTRPSNNSPEQWTATRAAPWRTPAPDVPTMAAYVPPTAARPAYVPELAWSAEQPEYDVAPAAHRARSWFTRSRVPAFGGGLLVAAAAVGLLGALHAPSSTAVNTSAQSAPAPTAAPMPAAPSTPAPRAASAPTASHPATASRGHSVPTSHQAPPQSPPPAPRYQPSDDQSGSSTYHSGWDSSRWRSDHDTRWNFWPRDHDRGSRSNSSSDHHSNGSSEDGNSK